MSLVDILVGTFLVSLIFVGLFGAFQLGFRVLRETEARVVAANMGKARIEEIRNLPYGDIGTVGADLPFAEGTLEEEKTVERNSVSYTLETRVKYVVDGTDGLGSPEDECPNDYKKVQVDVSWSGFFGGSTTLLTNVAPEDLAEECVQTGGVIGVRVFDSRGEMVSSPLIEVFDLATGDLVDSATPDGGEHYFPLSPATYKVKVSKSGFGVSRTYGEEEVSHPAKPHVILADKEVEEISFSIDTLSSFSVDTISEVEENGTTTVPAPDVEFGLRGEKVIGTDSEDQDVYEYSKTLISDSEGHKEVSDLETDNYHFSVDEEKTGLTLVKTDPAPQPVSLPPGTNKAVDLYVESENSLLVSVEDKDTGDPVFSGETRLFKSDYDKTQYTDEEGETYFLPLEAETYDLEVEAPGYEPASTTVSVSGFSTETVNLTRTE